MKQAAYHGMHSNTGRSNETSDYKTEDISQEQDETFIANENEEVQEFIDMALIEMNNGNYDNAIKLLDDAKQLYPNSRAGELQDLIIKLQANSSNNKYTSDTQNYPTSNSKSSVHQRKRTSPEEPRSSSDDYKSHTDYTTDQLNLVNKINNCKSYYQVLSISRDATDNEIKKSYKKLALNLHPDKNHAPGAVEAFKTLGNAMAVLTDAKKRKEYDLGGGNYITSNCNSHKSPSSSYHQFYSPSQQHHHYSSSEASYSGGEEFTAEELFHMFFGSYPSSQAHYRRRAYQSANQRQPQEQGQQPSLAFGLLLIMILMSMFMSLFSNDPVYNLSHSSKYNVRRQTQHLSVPYYVNENFDSDYQGSLARLENSVEEDYIYTMKQHCFRERNYREAMMARARSFGSRAQFAQAQGLKMPSCDNLSKIGITRYSLY